MLLTKHGSTYLSKRSDMATSSRIENLVFEGGGVKGAAYAGCIQVLAEHNLLQDVKRVAGTSAGSITAALLAIGAGSDGVTRDILQTDYNKFVADPGWIFGDIFRVFWRYGIHSGDGFEEAMKGFIEKYTQDPDLTFIQLDELVAQNPEKFKKLSVVASNITTQQADIFDSQRTPYLPIWKAVRSSMSIPLVFEPFLISNNYYVDGGLGWNYPIDLFDEKNADGEDVRNAKTLGFFLEPRTEVNHPGFVFPNSKIYSLKTAASALFDFYYNSANVTHMHPDDKSRTVFVDDLGISATDFRISILEKNDLVKSGRDATSAFLASEPVPQLG